MPCAKPLRRAFLITNHAPDQIVSGYENILSQDIVIAVDAGLIVVDLLGLKPTIIIGDLDSADRQLLLKYNNTPKLTHPTEKNETDTELAINWCLKQDKIDEIIVCNDMQGRFDHALGLVQNLLMLHKKRGKKPAIHIESADQQVFILPIQMNFHNKQGQLISLISLSPKGQFLSSQGLKYPLDGLILRQSQSRGISNEFSSDHAEIILLKGDVLALITFAANSNRIGTRI